MLYGGSKEASASVVHVYDDVEAYGTDLDGLSKDAEVMLKLESTPDKREQYRLMRDAMEKRFVRVTRGSIVGGVCLGMFTAAFCGLQKFFAEKRGVHDVYNVVGAGSATAATFGLINPGLVLYVAGGFQEYLQLLPRGELLVGHFPPSWLYGDTYEYDSH